MEADFEVAGSGAARTQRRQRSESGHPRVREGGERRGWSEGKLFYLPNRLLGAGSRGGQEPVRSTRIFLFQFKPK